MSRIKAVQKGDKISFEIYGEAVAAKYHKQWVRTKLLTPELANELKRRIKNAN